MTILRNILAGIAGALGLIFIAGFLLPDFVHVKRSVIIDAPREEVFDLVGNFHEWPEWSPFLDFRYDVNMHVSGEGVGHRVTWVSRDDNRRNGYQTIVHYQRPSMVETKLDLGQVGYGKASFVLLNHGDTQTKVIWSYYARTRDGAAMHQKPGRTYVGYAMDRILGTAYERGLNRLKDHAENEAVLTAAHQAQSAQN